LVFSSTYLRFFPPRRGTAGVFVRLEFDENPTSLVAHFRLFAHRKNGGSLPETGERRPRVFLRIHGHAVYGEKVIAHLDVDTRLAQRTAPVDIPRSPFQDPGDPVGAVFETKIAPRHPHRHVRGMLHVAAEIVRVADIELGDHLSIT